LNTAPVDLARRELWTESLERSQERRLRTGVSPGMAARDLLPARQRDLTDPDVWVRSGWRSRARRDAAVTRSEMPKPSPRGMSLAALMALVGGPAAGAAAGLVGGTATAVAKPAVASRGGGVTALQRALGIGADGVFGPQTARAVKAYQRNHGLTADGIAGPQTRSRLGLGSGSVLKRGGKAHRGGSTRTVRSSSANGGGVSALQRRLGVGADGAFGPQTEGAVKRYQSSHGLTSDGIVGPQTRESLGLGSGPVLKRKSAGASTGGGGGGGGSGSGSSVVQRVIAAGNRIATAPYLYGGGHGSFNSPAGYDCSGSVSYALHGAGLLDAPMASGGFTSYGAPGPGKHITIYANAGHMYMTVDGRRFDTSSRKQSGSRWTSEQRPTAGYTVRHPPGL